MSKVVVIGGTGFAGSHIAREAVGRGHEIVALSRSAPDEPIDGVRYVQRQASDAGELVADADVVIGALSPRAGTEGTLIETYAILAEQAAEAHARLIVIGGFGSLRPAPGAPRFAEGADLDPMFAPEAREMLGVLTKLTERAPASLDWIFVSPAGDFGAHLSQDEPRGTYRVSDNGVALSDADGNSAISGADFATAVVDELDNPSHNHAHLHFAY